MNSGKNVTVFNDGDTIYCNGGERSDEWLYMNNMPAELENKC